jgi:hypothetical protein
MDPYPAAGYNGVMGGRISAIIAAMWLACGREPGDPHASKAAPATEPETKAITEAKATTDVKAIPDAKTATGAKAITRAPPRPARQSAAELLRTKQPMLDDIRRVIKEVHAARRLRIDEALRISREQRTPLNVPDYQGFELVEDVMLSGVSGNEVGLIMRGRCTRDDLIAMRDTLDRLKIAVRSQFSELRCWAMSLDL